MKKAITLIALAVSAALAACSDDKTPSGIQLPAEPVSGQALTLVLNGAPCRTGEVRIEASGAASAELTLDNVVTGYRRTALPVQLTQRPDGSIEFEGAASLAIPGSGAEKMSEAIFDLTAKGLVLADGTVSMQVATALTEAGAGQLAGTWPLSKDLAYLDEDDMLATYPTTPVQLAWTAIDPDSKNGEQLALLGRKLLSQLLSELLRDVTLDRDGNITASWYPSPITEKAYDEEQDEFYDVQTYLEENEMTEYYDATTWWMMSKLLYENQIHVWERSWRTSPRNMAAWYMAGEEFRVLLNLPAILAETMGDGGEFTPAQILAMIDALGEADDAQLTEMAGMLGMLIDPEGKLGIDLSGISPALIRSVIGMLETGIPLKYSLEEGVLKLHADREMAAPFMEVILGLTPALDKLLGELATENPMMGMVTSLLAVDKMEDYKTIWADNTADFDAGLCFSKKAAATQRNVRMPKSREEAERRMKHTFPTAR